MLHFDKKEVFCILSHICRMLDENFKDQMEEIVKLSPRGRQTMLFSATMTDEVQCFAKVLAVDHRDINGTPWSVDLIA